MYPDYDPKITALTNSIPSGAKIEIIPWSSSDIQSVSGLLDESIPKVTGGGGGWQVVPRRNRVGFTQWQGNDPVRVQFGIIFNGWGNYGGGDVPGLRQAANNVSQETNCANLDKMWFPVRDKKQRPTTVKYKCPGGILPFDEKIWVIENVVWGDNVIKDRDSGARIRAGAAITLLEFVDDIVFQTLSAAKTNKTAQAVNGAFAIKNVHIVKAGETLVTIAKQAGTTWNKLGKINGIRDPLSITVGQSIKLK